MDLEQALLGAPCTLTRDEVIAAAGVDPDEAEAIWAAMGFAQVPPHEAAFTELDVDALRTAAHLRDSEKQLLAQKQRPQLQADAGAPERGHGLG